MVTSNPLSLRSWVDESSTRALNVVDNHTRLTLPEGSQVRSGAPAILPVKLLFSLGVLFEELGCVSEAYVAFIQFTRPDSSTEPPHLALEIRMREDAPMQYSELLLKMEETIKKSYPNPEKPIDIFEIGGNSTLKGPFGGAQLFCKFVDGKAVPM